MTEKTNGERLERMETNLETLSKAFEALRVGQAETNRLLNEMKLAQAKESAKYASREYVDSKISAVDIKLSAAQKDNNRQRWVQNTLSAILGIILATLVAIAFNKINVE